MAQQASSSAQQQPSKGSSRAETHKESGDWRVGVFLRSLSDRPPADSKPTKGQTIQS